MLYAGLGLAAVQLSIPTQAEKWLSLVVGRRLVW
jgi:hypothetical protein